MNAIIEKYCNKNKGLFLLDSPTGFGKTYSVVEYIFNLFNSGSDRKIFFITNLKNNLPIKEIKERFNSSSKNMNFENKFIFLRPYYEEVIDVLKNENIVKEIPSEILLTEEYKEIKKKVDLLTTLDLNKDLINAFLDEIREKHEPLFREKIKKYILNNFKSKKEALNKIKRNENNKWNWLIKLYPCVLLKEKQIFFMSVDKFIKPVSNLIEESFYFYNSDFINDSLIFIDEFDSSKDAILNSIIDEGINEKIEFISLFLKIYNNLTNHSYPNYIVKKASSFNSDKAIKTTTDLKDIIKEFKNIADKIFKDFHLEYSIKNKEINTQSKNNFLFQDIEFITILNDEKKIHLFRNKSYRKNELYMFNK